MNQASFSNIGTIESFTMSRMPPDGFGDALFLALVRLKEGPLVLCSASSDYSDHIEIGSKVRVEKNKEGLLTFRPT
ncbi:MAG: OB-fold domain-containing protein [Candidatus Thorarchaeota archaeon]